MSDFGIVSLSSSLHTPSLWKRGIYIVLFFPPLLVAFFVFGTCACDSVPFFTSFYNLSFVKIIQRVRRFYCLLCNVCFCDTEIGFSARFGHTQQQQQLSPLWRRKDFFLLAAIYYYNAQLLHCVSAAQLWLSLFAFWVGYSMWLLTYMDGRPSTCITGTVFRIQGVASGKVSIV